MHFQPTRGEVHKRHKKNPLIHSPPFFKDPLDDENSAGATLQANLIVVIINKYLIN